MKNIINANIVNGDIHLELNGEAGHIMCVVSQIIKVMETEFKIPIDISLGFLNHHLNIGANLDE